MIKLLFERVFFEGERERENCVLLSFISNAKVD